MHSSYFAIFFNFDIDSATNNTMDLSAKRPRYYSYSPAPLTGPNSVDESFPINDEVRSSSPKNGKNVPLRLRRLYNNVKNKIREQIVYRLRIFLQLALKTLFEI